MQVMAKVGLLPVSAQFATLPTGPTQPRLTMRRSDLKRASPDNSGESCA